MADLDDMIRRMDPNSEHQVTGLVATIMMANLRDYQHVSGNLIEGLMAENKELKVLLSAIRGLVTEAMSGKYMPTPAYIKACLYPTNEMIREVLGGYDYEM